MSATRRTTRRGLALIAAAALALTACGSSDSDDPSSSSAAGGSTAAAQESAAGNSGAGSSAAPGSGEASGSEAAPVSDADIDPDAVLTFTSAGPVRNLDPALQTSYGGWGYLALIWDRLTMLDKDDQVIPGLATEWAFSDDGSTLELKLRDDVTFNDGTPFNAEAVKVNIERGQNLEDSSLKSVLSDIEKVEVVDDYTVRLHVKDGSGVQLPSTFATDAGMMVSPKAIEDGADLQNDPGTAGSAAYVVSEYIANEKVVLKKADDDYWDPAAGRLAGMELLRVPEATTRLNGVQTGQTDLSMISSANDLLQAKSLADSGQLQQTTTPARNTVGIYLRADQGALVKPEVRQAIAYAVDPAQINALYSDTCTPTRQLVPANDPTAIPDYTYPYEFDMAKAKELVSAAGGAKVQVTFAAGTNAEAPANVIQAAMAEAGIEATLNPIPNSENEPRFIAGDFELMVATSWSPKIDPAATVSTYLLNTYKLAVGDGADQVAKDAKTAADPTLSMDERAPMYQDIWKTALEQAWFIPLCNSTFAAIHNDKVIGADNVPWTNIGIWDLRYVAKKKG